ncbi:MAG: hypothetical protein B7Y39_17150 [Bdellovibrio sp. 28-41-41]|nr:MAG: hypothetical protein B7Y39_17150 [Bdellovibrio sp. 28-41-41]
MKTIPFYLLLVMTFGLAGLDKIIGAKIPSWFLEQFKGSLLDLFPGSMEFSFVAIALLEIATAAVLIVGLLKKEFLLKVANDKRLLQYGVVLAQVTFIALGFGQRLTHKYDAAGALFFYAALTFIAGQMALKAE